MLSDRLFHDFLLACDRDLAAEQHARACVHCGAKLDVSHYKRKPRGRPIELGPEHNERFSFCCRRDGCRGRATPPSLRFLGRRVYLAATVVLIAIVRSGATVARLERLAEIIPVPPDTVARWCAWWRDRFTTTPFWRAARARFMPPVDEPLLPGSLLQRFAVLPEASFHNNQLAALLRFIGPITGGRPG
jgi:hypothetical protein